MKRCKRCKRCMNWLLDDGECPKCNPPWLRHITRAPRDKPPRQYGCVLMFIATGFILGAMVIAVVSKL